jgi:F420-0:gamma-glutamyl ligase
MSNFIGTTVRGIKCPIIKSGDNIVDFVTYSILEACNAEKIMLENKDVIGITESLVARAQNNYCTIDELVEEFKNKYKKFGYNSIIVSSPIFSRNRFSMILKAIARTFKKVYIVSDSVDEVGNQLIHPITKLNYREYYQSIVEGEGAEFSWSSGMANITSHNTLLCSLHKYFKPCNNKNYISYNLKDIMSDKCEWGLLGSNKAGEELLKLFPTDCQNIVNKIQERIYQLTTTNVEVMIYGDGAFKDPVSGIWEFADPVVSPGYTEGLEGSPNEIKLKYIADDKFSNLSGEDLTNAIKNEIAMKTSMNDDNMTRQGTTPRRYVDLLGSLMDLTSGSGDKGTPIVLVQGYFNNFSN